jgi:hypothetical protein
MHEADHLRLKVGQPGPHLLLVVLEFYHKKKVQKEK